MKNPQRKIFVISSPSGGGKTTLGERLLKNDKQLVRSVSMTTRDPRGKEKNNKDYFFVSKAQFEKIKNQNGFLESAKVFGQDYGTPKKFVNQKLKSNKDVMLLIDVQGAIKVKAKCKNAVLIFIAPPSVKILEKRLKKRSTDSAKEIGKRLLIAKKEMRMINRYHYCVANDDLSRATNDLESIIRSERLKV